MLIVEREHGCSRDAAVPVVQREVRRRVARFGALEKDLGRLCDRLALPAAERTQAELGN